MGWLANLFASGIIDKILSFIPNPAEAAKAKQDLQSVFMKAAIDAEADQRAINKVEAASPSMFIAGGRPAAIWLCVFGLGWQFFVAPMLTWFIMAFHISAPALPLLGDTTLTDLLYALLGISGMRSVDKAMGKDNTITKGIVGIFK